MNNAIGIIVLVAIGVALFSFILTFSGFISFVFALLAGFIAYFVSNIWEWFFGLKTPPELSMKFGFDLCAAVFLFICISSPILLPWDYCQVQSRTAEYKERASISDMLDGDFGDKTKFAAYDDSKKCLEDPIKYAQQGWFHPLIRVIGLLAAIYYFALHISRFSKIVGYALWRKRRVDAGEGPAQEGITTQKKPKPVLAVSLAISLPVLSGALVASSFIPDESRSAENTSTGSVATGNIEVKPRQPTKETPKPIKTVELKKTVPAKKPAIEPQKKAVISEPQQPNGEHPWDKLSENMRMKDVRKILGKPKTKLKDDDDKKIEIWIYDDGTKLTFRKKGFVHRLLRED